MTDLPSRAKLRTSRGPVELSGSLPVPILATPMDPERIDEVTARTWVDVDLGAIARNVSALAKRLPEGCGVLMVVKADAYGHGLEPVAQTAAAAGAWGFGVAALDEAARLRAAGIRGPIVCAMPLLPAEAARALALSVIPAITSLDQAMGFDAVARAAGRRFEAHLDIDTGLGRTGVWDREAIELMERMAKLPGRCRTSAGTCRRLSGSTT